MRTDPLSRQSASPLLPAAFLGTAFVIGGLAAYFDRNAPADAPPAEPVAVLSAPAAAPDAAAIDILRAAMLGSGFGAPPADTLAALSAPADPQPATPAPPAAAAPAALPAMRVPLPVARPADIVPRGVAGAVVAALPRSRRARSARLAAAPAPAAEEPSLLERFFGIGKAQAPGPALAYAALGGNEAEGTWRKGVAAVPPPAKAPPRGPVAEIGAPGTAVYDITARVVRLPNGETLEAHSGYGEMMDDPNHVHVPMRGPTPPGVYDLTEREAPFHGVRAIRLTPVGGSAAIHGRDGILAHTYMLRAQPGASNGCVVFRDYDRFLQAYLKGEIKRLVVVARSA